jgi:hypothetical protein
MDEKVLFGMLLLALSCAKANEQEPKRKLTFVRWNLQEALLTTLAQRVGEVQVQFEKQSLPSCLSCWIREWYERA